MGFADHYLSRQQPVYSNIHKDAIPDPGYCIIIPCYNEDNLTSTLESLWNCRRPEHGVEIIIVVNSSQADPPGVIRQNQLTIHEFEDWHRSHRDPGIDFKLIDFQNMPVKFAGAGLARKTGMDAAVSLFNDTDHREGLIISLDADCTCDENYLTEIESAFRKERDASCALIYFEHPVSGNGFPPMIYSGIIQYELYLRYHVEYLRFIKYPIAFHTLGSCFAVKADAYVRQGGMNRKKAGEDFYFLQKLFLSDKIIEINQTRVIPSPRPSLRIPFGTGPVIHKLMESGNRSMDTYTPEAYDDLGKFIALIPKLFRINLADTESLLEGLPDSIYTFLLNNGILEKINEINQNTGSKPSFIKRVYNWFNAFMVVKFLNTAHQKHYDKLPVSKAAGLLLQKKGYTGKKNTGSKALLTTYRYIQRSTHYTIHL